MKRLSAALFIALLTACSGGPADDVETLSVRSSEFVISLIAAGKLEAEEFTAIRLPPGDRSPRTISWLAPNHSVVKSGDIIVRFDTSDAELGALQTGIELTKVDMQVLAKQRELERLLSELGHELELVDIEKLIAEQFNIEDSLAYSRQEIIDATRDRELLDFRAGYLENKKADYSDRQSAEIEVLQAQREAHESENRAHRHLLQLSELRAPHDGLIVYEETWWGQTVDVGSSVYPGNNIAHIPNLEKMEAVLNVLETEATGLAPGLYVDVLIDAYPDRPLTGKVKNISATAAPIARNVPVKYFTVTISLDQSDPEWITPESRVTAEIHIARIANAIAVPNQVLFQDGGGDWVLVRNRREFEKRYVKLGLRGGNRSQILSGLAEGEQIAMYPPEGWRL